MQKVSTMVMSEWNDSMMLTVKPNSNAVLWLTWYRALRTNVPTLEVTFKNGKAYRYSDVPLDTFVTIVNSASIGVAINSMIIGKYVAVQS